MKTGRNEPCPCGSGRKFKKCCLAREAAHLRPLEVTPELRAKLLEHVPRPGDTPTISAMHKGLRFRAVGKKLYARKPTETFHEFLLRHLQWTLGKGWWFAELGKPDADRHQIMQWYREFYDLQAAHETEESRVPGGWAAPATGGVKALLTLAHDTYTLQMKEQMSNELRKRLRDRRGFQGARYEIAIGATLSRAGYDLIPLTVRGVPHCEFIARLPGDRIGFGVEAKSRHRRGVLHESGTFDPTAEFRADIAGLLHEARRQAPPVCPFVVFIDINVPPDFAVTEGGARMWDEAGRLIEESVGPGDTDPASLVVVTNMSPHFYVREPIREPSASMFVFPKRPRVPLDSSAHIERITEALRRYGDVPGQA